MSDRKKVIRLIEKEISVCESVNQGYRTIDLPALRDILTLPKELEWKLITEDSDGILHGLPGDDGQYLMTDGKDIWIDEYVDGVDDGIWLDSGRDIREIKAWMYMPELPEQKGR